MQAGLVTKRLSFSDIFAAPFNFANQYGTNVSAFCNDVDLHHLAIEIRPPPSTRRFP